LRIVSNAPAYRPGRRALAAEFAELREVQRDLVTREYLDLSLGKLRAELERDIAGLRADTQRDTAALRADMERMLREQTNKLITWLGIIVGLAVAIVGGLGVPS
jgi:hypothetical protein